MNVLVERNGETERLPIVDLTCNIQLGLLSLGVLIITIISFALFARRREKIT
jgi:hypothetical protein